MLCTIIHDLPDWEVTSYGNGLSYRIFNKSEGQAIFFQGDDAEIFRDELETLTEGTPALDFADALSLIWSDYAEIAE